MPSAAQIVLEYVCPTLGILTANAMFYAPFTDVQTAIARGSLGDLNPLPWAFMLGNCFGWVTYSILIDNLFVFFANVFGFLLAAWFNLAATKLLFRQQFTRISSKEDADSDNNTDESPTSKDKSKGEVVATDGSDVETTESAALPPTFHVPRQDYWVMGMVTFWMAVVATIGFGKSLSDETRQMIVGIVVNLNLVFFYGAPLSTILIVIRTRNTASIHVWTMLTNTANGIFWMAYGLAVLDYFIIVPNGLGAILGFIQMILLALFPRVETSTGEGAASAPITTSKTTISKDEETGTAAFASSETALDNGEK